MKGEGNVIQGKPKTNEKNNKPGWYFTETLFNVKSI